MARYFQAPDLQPLQYGPEMPFQEIMAVLQQKQKLQDTTIAEGNALRDPTIKALEKDYGLRDRVLGSIQSNLDRIMYDDKGRLKDLSTGAARAEIQKEARRQANLKKTGGVWWGLETSYNNWEKYEKDIDEMYKGSKIGADRLNFLKSQSMARYQGIKQQGNHFTNLFTGIDAAKEEDEVKYAIDLTDGYKSNQVQISTIPGGLVERSVTPEYLAELKKKYPDMISLQNGAYLQDGTLEYVLYDEVYNFAFTNLANNKSIMADLVQEAQQYGATTNEEINKYVTEKIEYAAHQGASKSSYFKFDPNIRENWQARIAREHAYRKAEIDYENALRERTMDVSLGEQTVEIQGDKLIQQRDAAELNLEKAKKDLQSFLNKDGTVRGEVLNDPLLMEQYTKANNDYLRINLEYNQLTETINGVTSSKGITYASTIATTVLGDAKKAEGFKSVFGTKSNKDNLAQWEAARNAFQGRLKNYSQAQLAEFSRTDQWPEDLKAGLEQVKHAEKKIMDVALNTDKGEYQQKVKQHYYWSSAFSSWDNLQGAAIRDLSTRETFTGEYTSATGYKIRENIKKETDAALKGSKVAINKEVSSRIGLDSGDTNKAFITQYNKALTSALTSQSVQLNTIDGTGTRISDVNAWAASIASAAGSDWKVAEVSATSTGQWDPMTGEKVNQISTVIVNNKGQRKTVSTAVIAAPGTHNNISELAIEGGYKMVNSAGSNHSEAYTKTQVVNGTKEIGWGIYGKSYAQSNGQYSAAGLSNQPIPVSKNGVTPDFFLKKHDNGTFTIQAAVKGKDGKFQPDPTRLLPNVAYGSKPGDVLYKDLDAVMTTLGAYEYMNKTGVNPFKPQ